VCNSDINEDERGSENQKYRIVQKNNEKDEEYILIESVNNWNVFLNLPRSLAANYLQYLKCSTSVEVASLPSKQAYAFPVAIIAPL
jgi:hypothetical protein